MVKDLRFYLRLTDEDRRMLDEVAKAMSIAPSQVIRVLVREKHRELHPAQAPTVTTRKRRKR